jgi:hypothetical protein
MKHFDQSFGISHDESSGTVGFGGGILYIKNDVPIQESTPKIDMMRNGPSTAIATIRAHTQLNSASATPTHKHPCDTLQQPVETTINVANKAGITASGTVKFKIKEMIDNTIAAFVTLLL